jgi:inhibitor of cysteine peptidase
MHKFFTLALVSIPLFASISTFAAIDDTQVIDRESTTVSDINLKSFASCEAMDTVLTKYFKQTLIDQVSMYGGSLGKPVMMENATANPSPSLERGGIGGGGGDVGFSQTNVQIAGIDEAEVVKTDGKYIYYASNQPDADGFNYVTITRAVPASDMSLVKRIKLPSNYGNIQLYLADGRLTILANRWNQNYVYNPTPVNIWNGSVTVVVVYDITDPTQPQLSRFYTVNGDLSQSRRDGDYLYVLSQNYVSLNTWGPVGMYSKEEVSTYMDKKFEVDTILPQSIDIKRNNSTAPLDVGGKKIPYSITRGKVKCSEIEYLLPEKPQNLSFLTLSVIPLRSGADVTRKVIYGDASQFFMSKESFYIVGNYWKQGGNFSCPPNARCIMPMFRSEQNSLIHRFSMKSGKVSYVYSVLTPGMPLSQYALNERDGVLFTANQKDWTTNGVDIFAIDATGKLLSKLENVGAKERFQAARYIGNRLYLVTFEQVDPLFVIDTTAPKSMKIMGELVMPGYSTYLHPYDDNHLIGIGYDTKENQWGGTTNAGIKVDLYDVSDITKPKQKYSQVYGGVGSSSDALGNPRALVWDDARKVLLLPAQLMDQNQITYQYNSAWQGLLALKIDKNTGITQEAKISHIDMTGIAEKRKTECAQYVTPITEEKCYTHIVTGEKICLKPQNNPENQTIPTYCYAEFDDSSYLANNIWNLYTSFVQRGLYIGNSLYTVSPNTIQSNVYGGNYDFQKKVNNTAQ